MTRKKEAETLEETLDTEAQVHPDLKALIREVRRRDRQGVVARLLVDEFARADELDPETAWLRHRRALEIDRVAALRKGELAKTDLASLIAEIEGRIGG